MAFDLTLNDTIYANQLIFKRLKLLKVSDILIMQELKFYYKFTHKKLPSYLQNLPLYANTNTHNYSTRTKQNVHLEFILNHEYAKMCQISSTKYCQ